MAYNDQNYFILQWGVNGTPVDTEFVMPGCSLVTDANEHRVTMARACAVVSMEAMARVAPGGAIIDDYEIYVDGAGSGESLTMTGAAQTGTWSGSVAVAAGSEISLYFSTSGATAADDVGIIMRCLTFI